MLKTKKNWTHLKAAACVRKIEQNPQKVRDGGSWLAALGNKKRPRDKALENFREETGEKGGGDWVPEKRS